MAITIKTGEPIVLNVQLSEPDNDKYIRAFVIDDNGASLAGSPFILGNIGNGTYRFKDENNLVFPSSTLQVYARYEIHDTPTFDSPTIDYQFQIEDVWKVFDSVDDQLEDRIEDLEEIADKLAQTVVESLILRDDLEIDIQEDEPIEATIQDD